MAEILTTNEVARMHTGSPVGNGPPGWTLTEVQALCDSHAALRAALDRLERGLKAISQQADGDANARNEFGCCGCVRKYETIADELLMGNEWDGTAPKGGTDNG